MGFLMPKPKAPPPPPTPPVQADASILDAGNRVAPMDNFVATGSVGGLKRKANTVKSSLLGSA